MTEETGGALRAGPFGGEEADRRRTSLGQTFRLYAIGQAVSIIGDRVALIALVFLVLHLSHAYGAALAVFYVCRALPDLLGGVAIGVIVDHFQRRPVMIAASLASAFLMAVVPAASALSIWTVFPVVFALYALDLLFSTASRAAIPDVVPPERLTVANATLNTLQKSGDIFYALGGLLVLTLGFQAPFYIDAATFAFLGLMITFMRIPANDIVPLQSFGSVSNRVTEGVKYILHSPFLKWSTVCLTVAPLAGGAALVLAPLYASHTLSRSADLFGVLRGGAVRFSLLEVGIGLGAVVGGVLAAKLAHRFNRGALFGAGVLGVGIAYAVLAFVQNLYVAILVMAIGGMANGLFFVSEGTLAQELTPSDMRGRVFGAQFTIVQAAVAIGSALGGLALSLVSYQELWLILGVTIAAASFAVWLQPTVRAQR